MKKYSGFRRWGPAAGVVAVGLMAFSLTLEGAGPSPQPQVMKERATGAEAPPVLIEGSDVLPGTDAARYAGPTRSGHATTTAVPDPARLPEGIKFGRVEPGGLPIMEPMTVDYRDDIGTRMRKEGKLIGAYRPWKVEGGQIAAGGCSFDIDCDDCNPCTQDVCDISVGDALGSGTCLNNEVAVGAEGGCSDGLCCNGRETCVGPNGSRACEAPGAGTGTFDPNACEFPCSGGNVCNESSNLCRLPCTGAGTCAISGGPCASTQDCPTGPGLTGNYCLNCQDGVNCNGVETCVAGICEAGTNPCGFGATCGERDCSGPGTTPCTTDSDCVALQLGLCNLPGPICFPGRCCDPNATPEAGCSKRKKSGGTCAGGAIPTAQCESDAQCDVCVGGVNIRRPCTVNADCPGSTCNTGGSCNVGASCDTAGGRWYATDDGQLPITGGLTCPTPQQENPANDRTLCPKYSSGIAPIVDFDTENAFTVGFFSQGPCDHDDIGDDYEFDNNLPVAMEIFRWVGGGGGRLQVEFYDENGAFIEDVITGAIGGGNAVRSLNFLPPLTLPGKGYFVIRVATNFAPNGQTFVTATDAVDEGINLASGTGSIWFDGGPSSVQLRECVGGTNDGVWCDPDDPGDSECVNGGGACQNRNNILAFEIEGLKVPLPTGACCNGDLGACDDGVAPWVCTAGGGVYQGNDSTCPANCGMGACCIAGTCTLTNNAGCAGTFQGSGTDCEPNCCLQTFTGADNCAGATVHNINVPPPGDDPVVVTISGNNSGATGPDTCLQGSWNAAGGTYLTVDAGWWEAFRIDSCAFVRVDFCCSDPIVEPAWALMWTGCPCEDAIFTAVNPNTPELPANRRGGPFCEDDNLWNQFGPLAGGTCTGGTNPGSACTTNSQCTGGNTCTPGRTYYVPVYSVPPGANDAYQMHITVEACPVAACCDGTSCVETDQLGCAAIDGANFLAPPFRTQATTVCSANTCTSGSCCYVPGQGLCQDIASGQLMTETLCDDANGSYKGGARCFGCVCAQGSPPASCDGDEDCGVNGPCNNPQGGACSGQNQTQPSPCPVCDFESVSRCQRQPGYDGARLSDICAGDCVSDPPVSDYSLPGIRAADDFTAAVGGDINSVCVWGIWFDQNAGGADCSDSEVVEKFTVTIYNDANGVPGSIVGDRRSTTVVRKARTFTSGTRGIFQWQLALSAPLPVVQGNTYWLEVVNNTDESTGLPGCDWMWALSDPDAGADAGNGLTLQDLGDVYTFDDAIFDGADLAWCIDLDNTVPLLPEAACCTCGGGIGTCQVLSLEDCTNADGQWISTEPDCIGVNCPNTGPANDNCAAKTVVSSNSNTGWSNYCTNTDGPASAGNASCTGGLDYQNDLWYAWTAPESCEVTIETCDLGGEIDTAILVYTDDNGTCPCPTSSANETQCDDDGCVFQGAASRITMQATAGTCYTIRVTSFLGEKGSGVLHISDCVINETPPPQPIADPNGEKVRFISFSIPGPSVGETALRVNLTTLHAVNPPYAAAPTIPFTAFQGQSVWVGPPSTWVEAAATPGLTFKSAQTQCTPHYRDWSTEGLIHVRGSAIVPSSSYAVDNVSAACQGNEGSASCLSGAGGPNVSDALVIGTRRWGDIEVPFNPPSPTTQPDLADVSAMVNKFRGAPGAPIKARALIAPNDAFGNINDATMGVDFGFTHISLCVDAFRGARYPGQMGRCTGAPASACTTNSDCGGNGPCILYCP